MAAIDNVKVELANRLIGAVESMVNKYIDRVDSYEFDLQGVSLEVTPVKAELQERDKDGVKYTRETVKDAVSFKLDYIKVKLKMRDTVK
jgi:hypothetical protein